MAEICLTKARSRYIDRAVKAALTSTYGRFRHGAVLVSGGRVINSGYNKPNFCSFAERFREAPGPATFHAEIDCIYNVSKEHLTGAAVYVVRLDTSDKLRMSRPCDMCLNVLRFCGVTKVYYSDNDCKIWMEKT
mgnify:CR=1 FL=1